MNILESLKHTIPCERASYTGDSFWISSFNWTCTEIPKPYPFLGVTIASNYCSAVIRTAKFRPITLYVFIDCKNIDYNVLYTAKYNWNWCGLFSFIKIYIYILQIFFFLIYLSAVDKDGIGIHEVNVTELIKLCCNSTDPRSFWRWFYLPAGMLINWNWYFPLKY